MQYIWELAVTKVKVFLSNHSLAQVKQEEYRKWYNHVYY